ncbi:hypothetical protein D3C86_1375910 [compost metagenome]
MHQHLAARVPYLKGNLAFVRVTIAARHRFTQCGIERPVQFGVFFARQWHAHDALQQARILRQLSVVNLGDFVIAVVQIEEAEHRQTGQQQADDQGQCAAADGSHQRSSTR